MDLNRASLKEELIQSIRNWVKIDNDIRVLNKECALKRKEQKKISQKLIETMKQNSIDEFGINDGKICYTSKNVKKPISKKILFDILSKYFEGDTLKATEMNNFILENREETIKETITRKINS